VDVTARDQAIDLIQRRYYDPIDRGDMAEAAKALHEDVRWSHAKVWKPTAAELAANDELRGRAEVLAYLEEQSARLADSSITHEITDMVVEGDRGAHLGKVIGPGGEAAHLMVWFEMTDGLISTYIVRPL
jgi:ketosteroid isomerase-like protein